MKHFSDQAIVLTRTNFGEADRILTFLTRAHGKVRGMARGVRKQKSKLAGGIELFSTSEISFLVGQGEISTIASSRLVKHFGSIVKDLDRTNAAYDFLKQLNQQTEDQAEPEYFDLLQAALEALDTRIDIDLCKIWFKAQLLRLSGSTPNLHTDRLGHKLAADCKYDFNFESMSFTPAAGRGKAFSTNDIKFLRLLFGAHRPVQIKKVAECEKLVQNCAPILNHL